MSKTKDQHFQIMFLQLQDNQEQRYDSANFEKNAFFNFTIQRLRTHILVKNLLNVLVMNETVFRIFLKFSVLKSILKQFHVRDANKVWFFVDVLSGNLDGSPEIGLMCPHQRGIRYKMQMGRGRGVSPMYCGTQARMGMQ